MEPTTSKPSDLNNIGAKDSLLLGVFYFAIYVFIYGLMVFRFGMHQDEILDFDGRALGTYVGGGRWMVGLWRLVFESGYLPYASGLIAGVLIAVTLVMQTQMLGIRGMFSRVVYGCMYLGCIQFAWMLVYSHQSDAIAMGFLLSTLSVQAFCGAKPRWCVAIVCATLALAVYQTNALYIAVLYMAVLLRDGKMLCAWRRTVAFAGCMAAAFALWKVGVLVSYQFPWVSDGQIEYQQNYQKGMTQWHQLAGRDLAFLITFFGHYILEAAQNLLGLTYKGQWVYATVIPPLLFLMWRAAREETRLRACWRVALLLGVWTLPFVFPVIMGTIQGPRTNLAEPLSCALLWAMAVARLDVRFRRATGKALSLFLILVVFKGAVQVSVMARDEARDFRDAVAELRAMETCGIMLANEAGLPLERILLIGISEKDGDQALQAKSHIIATGTVPWHLLYLRSPFLAVASQEDEERLKETLEQMPAWPAPGSMKIHDGEVIIRLTPSATRPVPERTVKDRREYMGRFRL